MTLTAPSPEQEAAALAPDYAGLATRTLAFGADAAIITATIWFVAAVVGIGLSLLGVPDQVLKVLAVIGAVISMGWTIGYFAFFWSANGQTPGCRMLGIRVLTAATGEPPHFGRALVRVLLLPLSAILFCAGFLLILVDSRRRALHDRIVRTVVVYTPSGRRGLSAGRRPG
jgi:uncharacterized RDD family membrane protein YckC